ncbi:hypothetical protein Tco_0562604, partial [Tanacetum coccineum]
PLSFQTWVGEASISAAPLSVEDYAEEDTDEALGSVVAFPNLKRCCLLFYLHAMTACVLLLYLEHLDLFSFLYAVAVCGYFCLRPVDAGASLISSPRRARLTKYTGDCLPPLSVIKTALIASLATARVLKSGSDFSADFNRNLFKLASFPFSFCTSLRYPRDGRLRTVSALSGHTFQSLQVRRLLLICPVYQALNRLPDHFFRTRTESCVTDFSIGSVLIAVFSSSSSAILFWWRHMLRLEALIGFPQRDLLSNLSRTRDNPSDGML